MSIQYTSAQAALKHIQTFGAILLVVLAMMLCVACLTPSSAFGESSTRAAGDLPIKAVQYSEDVALNKSDIGVQPATSFLATSLVQTKRPAFYNNEVKLTKGDTSVQTITNTYVDNQGVIWSADKTVLILIPEDVSGVVRIPNNVKPFESDAFKHYPSLYGLKVSTNDPLIESLGTDNCLYIDDQSTIFVIENPNSGLSAEKDIVPFARDAYREYDSEQGEGASAAKLEEFKNILEGTSSEPQVMSANSYNAVSYSCTINPNGGELVLYRATNVNMSSYDWADANNRKTTVGTYTSSSLTFRFGSVSQGSIDAGRGAPYYNHMDAWYKDSSDIATVNWVKATRVGYYLIGFNTSPTATTSISFSSISSGTTYYAIWGPNSYNMTLDDNGGTGGDGVSRVIYDSSNCYYRTAPTRTGYTFTGYWTATSGGTQVFGPYEETRYYGYWGTQCIRGTAYWDNNDKWKYLGDVTFYAQWTKTKYTVTGATNSSAWGSAPYMVSNNSTTHSVGVSTTDYYYVDQYGYLHLKARPNTGYYFSSWSFIKGGSAWTPSYTNGSYVSSTATVTGYQSSLGNIVVTANYSPAIYSISYNGNGSTGGSTATSSHTYGTSKALTANGFSKTGYNFAGWNTKADGTGTSYANSASVSNLTTTNGATVTLYAQWTAGKYTMTLNDNGGSGGNGARTMTFGEGTNYKGDAPYRKGYIFEGYFTATTGGTQVFSAFKDQTSYNNEPGIECIPNTAYFDSNSKWKYTGNVTFYAHWREAPWIILNPNGGQFDLRLDQHGCAHTDRFEMEEGTYTEPVKFWWDWGGEFRDSGTGVVGWHKCGTFRDTPSNAWVVWNVQRKGYTFDGWAPTDDTDTVVSDGSISEGQTYYAQWSPIQYNVTTATNNSTYGSVPYVLTTPSTTHSVSTSTSDYYYIDWLNYLHLRARPNTGYKLTSWSFTKGGIAWTPTYKNGSSTSSDATVTGYQSSPGNIVVTANYGLASYNLYYNANGGTGAPAQDTYTYNTSKTLSSTVPTRAGYTFKGWSTLSSATSGTAAGGTITFSTGADVTLYATWLPNSYTISVGMPTNGDVETPSKTSYTVSSSSQTFTVTATPDTSYTIAGWTVTGGSVICSSQTAATPTFTIAANSTGNIVVTPIFELNKYTVYFDTKGGTGGTSSIDVVHGSSIPSITVPTLSGWTFSGYTDDMSNNPYLFVNADGTGTSRVITGSRTLVAAWTKQVSLYANGGVAGSQKALNARLGYALGQHMSGGGSADTPLQGLFTYSTAEQTTWKPTRTGYVFQGFYDTSAATGGTQWITSNGSGNPNTTTSFPSTLYARWSAASYEVSYNGNDNTGGSLPASFQAEYNRSTPYTLSSNVLTRPGYTHVGWYRTKQAAGTVPSDMLALGGQYTHITAGAQTLYAVWRVNDDTEYKVRHWKQNLKASATEGNGIPTGEPNYTLALTEDKASGKYGTPGDTVEPPVKVFAGFKSPLSTKVDTIAPDGSTVINYYYTRESYTLTVNKDAGVTSVVGAGTYQYEETVTPQMYSAACYAFKAWEVTGALSYLTGYSTSTNPTKFIMPARNVTITASTDAATYTISSVAPEHGTVFTPIPSSYRFSSTDTTIFIVTARPDTNYRLTDWNINGLVSGNITQSRIENTMGGQTITFTIGAGTTGNLMISPVFSQVAYSLSFDSNIGDSGDRVVDMPANQPNVLYAQQLTIPHPKRYGYIFNGWTLNPNANPVVHVGTMNSNATTLQSLTISNGETIKLYADWQIVVRVEVPINNSLSFDVPTPLYGWDEAGNLDLSKGRDKQAYMSKITSLTAAPMKVTSIQIGELYGGKDVTTLTDAERVWADIRDSLKLLIKPTATSSALEMSLTGSTLSSSGTPFESTLVPKAVGTWTGTEFAANPGKLEIAYTLRMTGLNEISANNLSNQLLRVLGDKSDFELKDVSNVVYTLELA